MCIDGVVGMCGVGYFCGDCLYFVLFDELDGVVVVWVVFVCFDICFVCVVL